jgi:hypothetical protein
MKTAINTEERNSRRHGKISHTHRSAELVL